MQRYFRHALTPSHSEKTLSHFRKKSPATGIGNKNPPFHRGFSASRPVFLVEDGICFFYHTFGVHTPFYHTPSPVVFYVFFVETRHALSLHAAEP